MKAGWWDAPLALWDLAEAIHMTFKLFCCKNQYVKEKLCIYFFHNMMAS